jgi:hypothetical protein
MERVIFVKEDGQTLAVFPSLKWDKVGNLTGYDGNHVPVSQSYLQSLEVIENPKEYLQLKQELISLGYQLQVLNGRPDTILRNVMKTR